MTILLLKLLLTPIFIGMVTLVGRRWGPAVSGLMVGFPLTSGPICVFLALEYGPAFAARAAIGQIAGMASSCLFCLAYGLAARKFTWPACVLISLSAFLASTALCHQVSWSLLTAALFLGGAVAVVPRLIGEPSGPVAASAPPGWDLPARMAVATAFVVALTASARALGPQLSGLIAPFPVFGVVLAAFSHHRQGPAAATRLVRANVMGAPAFLAFFLVAALGLTHGPTALVFLLATLGALGASTAAFLAMGRESPGRSAIDSPFRP